jgi:hypothetical protein
LVCPCTGSHNNSLERIAYAPAQLGDGAREEEDKSLEQGRTIHLRGARIWSRSLPFGVRLCRIWSRELPSVCHLRGSIQSHSGGRPLCSPSRLGSVWIPPWSTSRPMAADRALSSSCGRERRAYPRIWLRECRAAVGVLRKIGVPRARSFMGRLSHLRCWPIGGMDPRATPQSTVMRLPDKNQMQRTGAAQATAARR